MRLNIIFSDSRCVYPVTSVLIRVDKTFIIHKLFFSIFLIVQRAKRSKIDNKAEQKIKQNK